MLNWNTLNRYSKKKKNLAELFWSTNCKKLQKRYWETYLTVWRSHRVLISWLIWKCPFCCFLISRFYKIFERKKSRKTLKSSFVVFRTFRGTPNFHARKKVFLYTSVTSNIYCNSYHLMLWSKGSTE